MDIQARLGNREILIEELERSFAARTAEEWTEMLLAAGIPAGRMNTYPEAFESEHGRHREMRIEIPHPIEGSVPNIAPTNLRRLSQALGPAMVKRMLLLGEMPAAELLQPLGYLAAVVAPEALDAEVAAACERLLGHAPLTLRATKEMLRRLATDPEAEAPDLIRACYGSEDFRTGVAAFLAKATPHWGGR